MISGVDVSIITMGVTVVMGASTTFAFLSIRTTIFALSGAEATNVALAWFRGGVLVA